MAYANYTPRPSLAEGARWVRAIPPPESACRADAVVSAPLPVPVAFGALLSLTACTDGTPLPFELEFTVRSTHFEECRLGGGVLRFYVSDLRARDSNGARIPVELDVSGPWQDGRTALVALAADCASTKAHDSNTTVTARLPAGAHRHLEFVEFDLGVPFAPNHANPLRAEPPLNLPSMFWTWQTGYKFVRLDLGDRWSFHLGSTRCASASAARAPAQPCRQPNLARVRVRLPMPHALQTRIVVDLDALLDQVDVSRHPSCTDRYAERAPCGTLLAALGLDPITGECADGCAGQRVFAMANGTR